MRRLKVYSPDEITMFEIEQLITDGYRFDIVDGLSSEDYDKVEVLVDGEASLHSV